MKRLQVDGRVFLSSTTLGGDVWLRMAVLNARTHLDAVRSAIDVIQCTAGEVEKDYGSPALGVMSRDQG